jgi:hypothetical protein
MKFLTLTCCIFLEITFGFSQDVLTKISGDSIKVKVVEISSTEVKYKNYDDLAGITYGIFKSEVLMIRYESGRVETFKDQDLLLSHSEKCNCGRSDAEKFHGKKDAHFVLGLLFGTYAIIVTAAASQTPKKGKFTYKLSQHKALFTDPDYLKCYKKKAKSDLITMEAWGIVVRFAIPVAILFYVLQH